MMARRTCKGADKIRGCDPERRYARRYRIDEEAFDGGIQFPFHPKRPSPSTTAPKMRIFPKSRSSSVTTQAFDMTETDHIMACSTIQGTDVVPTEQKAGWSSFIKVRFAFM